MTGVRAGVGSRGACVRRGVGQEASHRAERGQQREQQPESDGHNIPGSSLIGRSVTPFAAAQFGVLGSQSRVYLLLNLAGSTLLAVLAAIDEQYGFLLLEGVWALVSAWGLLSLGRDPILITGR